MLLLYQWPVFALYSYSYIRSSYSGFIEENVKTLQDFSMNLFNRLEHELCRLVNDEWMSAAKYCGLNGEVAIAYI